MFSNFTKQDSFVLDTAAPLIMGVLNVTPDSFSDGGKHNDVESAVKYGLLMVENGANIIDVGGESTRPGAETIDATEQLRRVLPVISQLREELPDGFPISIDTTDIEVAGAAVESGVNWLNDISAAEDSSEMMDLAGENSLPIVLMHRQGKSATMQDAPYYVDVCSEVFSYLLERAEVAMSCGVAKQNIILDPGIGFGKSLDHNLTLLTHIKQLKSLGFRILIGVSRKTMIGEILNESVENRLFGSLAIAQYAYMNDADIFRVHDVKATADVLKTTQALLNHK